MAFIYTLMILFVLYCIISDWFMHEYGEKLNCDNFYKFKIDSFFSYQIPALKRLVSLNEENLAKQPIFWIGIILPLVIAGWVEYQMILLNPDLLSFKKLDEFFKSSSSALYISALIPTLGVIIANIHRTIQTKNQIEKTEEQINITKLKNNFDSFNSHMKIICDELKEFKVNLLSCEYVIKSRMKLYQDIFNESSPLAGASNSISNEFIRNLDKLYGDLYTHSTSYLMDFHINSDEIIIDYLENKTKINKIIYNIHDSIFYLFEHFGLAQENYKYLDFTYDNGENYNQLNIMHNIWEVLQEIDEFIEKLLYSIGYDFSIEKEFTQNFYGTYMIRKQLGRTSIKYEEDII
ncbi:hypothetical protein EX227_03435 [Providencia rettgeri]|uniref:Uncharacterized protein n=2 Tax=Providencia rettgeri TaxID=587 RepID=A0AAP2JXL5_PRORE|nr:hypothetical protein [Providencia rettgeri]EMB3080659.1 hypothetical protein [Providencia rettgeri]MBX6956596.1 hypothetical protein [Providencia rettgeri]MBX6960370.1 hypothetical protein [Providencia rettgeri]MBX6970772.1 hypothetical protein [Providencia rettgeri]MBX6979989.1 hypothetical protein [Providencia rettgeri]